MAWGESKAWKRGSAHQKLYQSLLDNAMQAPARNAKRRKVLHPEDMPWEMARQGLLKHLLNEQMNTRMETVDAYMQIIPRGSRSGRHRHLAEECLYVVEGRGYDLHQDCDVEITDTYHWKPQSEVKRYEWEAGDVIYIPPSTIHQHFNAASDKPVRLISAINRIYKYCGLNDLEQLEDAPQYDAKIVLTAALDESADRSARLVASAKREGSLSLYASMAEKDLIRLVSEFERRYAIKVKVWRSGKNNVLRRAVTEARAGRFEVDVVHNPSPEMELLHRERLLQEVRSPYQRELIAEAVAPHREWAGPRVYIFVQAYNTDRVTPEELPKTFADLLDPRWKGRIAIEAKEQEWFFTLVREMGGEAGLKFFRDLVANGLQVRMG